MEQAVEKKPFDWKTLLIRIFGGLNFAAQILLTFFLVFGVGSTFAGVLSVGSVIEYATSLLEIDFTAGFELVFDIILHEIVNVIFAIIYVLILVKAIITIVKGINAFRKAVFVADEEGWACVEKLKNGLCKTTASIVSFSILTSTTHYLSMSGNAVAGIWVGCIVITLSVVAKMLFSEKKMPNWPYVLMKCLKEVLKAVILVLFLNIFTGKYLLDLVNSFSFAICGVVSGTLEATTPLFMSYMSVSATSILFFILMSGWVKILKNFVAGNDEKVERLAKEEKPKKSSKKKEVKTEAKEYVEIKAENPAKKFLVTVIVIAVIDFALQAFVLGTYGDMEIVNKLGAWTTSATTTFIPLLCLTVAKMLSNAFPQVAKDAVWFNGAVENFVKGLFTKKETVEEVAAPVEEVAETEVAEEIAVEEVAETEETTEEVAEVFVEETSVQDSEEV